MVLDVHQINKVLPPPYRRKQKLSKKQRKKANNAQRISRRKYWHGLFRNDLCSFCGEDGGTIDHITPQSLGGVNNFWNYAGACRDCNHKKDSKENLLLFILEMRS